MRRLALFALALPMAAHAQSRAFIPKEVVVAEMGPGELAAHRVWNLRAALNVAALQCQFSPYLRTVVNYNTMLKQHAKELERTRATLDKFFRRTEGKGPARAFDQYTTRTYQSYSTLDAVIPFCETAARVGRDALGARIGELTGFAPAPVTIIRTSLTPIGDPLAATSYLPPVNLAYALCAERDRRRGRCQAG